MDGVLGSAYPSGYTASVEREEGGDWGRAVDCECGPLVSVSGYRPGITGGGLWASS